MSATAHQSANPTASYRSGGALSLPITPELVDAIAARVAVLLDAQQPDDPGYMDTDGVAAYLGYGRKRIDNLCGQHRIPFRKEGARRIFVKQEIDEWVLGLEGTRVGDALLANI